MCLITTCPKGTSKSREILDPFIASGMISNTDGTGFAAKKSGKNLIILEKGFRTKEAILDAIDKLKLTEEDELIIHHRTGTSGDKNDKNMHPFLISGRPEVLQMVKGKFNLPAMVHNGVFGSFSDYTSAYSDTYHFIEYFMSNERIMDLLVTNQAKFEEVYKTVLGGNKLAFLHPTKDMIRVGTFIEDEGYFHSNYGFRRTVYDYGGSSHRRTVNHNTDDWRNRNNTEYATSDNEPSCTVDYNHRLLEAHSNRNFIKENAQEMNLDKLAPESSNGDNKILGNNISFTGEEIEITKRNFMHFIFVPKIDTHSGLKMKKGYVIDDLEPSSLRNPVSYFNMSGEIFSVSIKDMAHVSTIYVKSEYRHMYEGLKVLVEFTNKNHNKKVINGLRQIISRSKDRPTVINKKYGEIFIVDVIHVYNRYKFGPKPAVPKITTSQLAFPVGEAIEPDKDQIEYELAEEAHMEALGFGGIGYGSETDFYS